MGYDVLSWILVILMMAVFFQVRSLKRRLRALDPADILGQLQDIKRLLRTLVERAGPTAGVQQPTPPAQEIRKPEPAAAVAIPAAPPPVPAVVPPSADRPSPIPLPPPPSPRPPSKFAQSVREILSRIWQWILVGEEYRPKGVSMEQAVATTWLMRAGIVALVTGVGVFLKWSADRNLIVPAMRVGLSTLFGLGMLGGGLRLLGKRWNVLGQGFVGGGIAILYFSMYALGPRYHLVDSQALVFGFMILVTVAAGVLALFTNSMLVAIFGLIGGFCTPICLRTDVPHLAALYGDLLLLNLGILGIAHARQWRLLNYLGFVFTWSVYFGSLGQYRPGNFVAALAFLSLFFAIQSTLVFLYNIRRRVPATVLEIVHLVLNAALYSAAAYGLILGAHGRPWPALMTLALALYFIAHVALFLGRGFKDRPLLVALVSLAGFYTTMTMPLLMEKESLTIAWALQAFMFLWIGRSLGNNFMRQAAYALYAVTFWRLLAHELPRFDLNPAATQAAVYWKALGSRLWTFGVSIGSVLAAYLVERKAALASGRAGAQQPSDTPDVVPSFVSRHLFFWGVVACLFLYLHFELYALFGFWIPWRPAALTLLWTAAAAFFALLYLDAGGVVFLASLVFFAVGACGKTLFVDIPGWQLCERGFFETPYLLAPVLARLLDFAAVLALLAGGALLLTRRRPTPVVPQVFGYTTLFLLWLYSTLELNTLLHWKLLNFAAGGISVLWTVFALSFVAGGLWKNARPIRYAGLALFAAVVAKVFLFDLAHMPALYRVLAVMAVGILLLVGAYAYLSASKRFTEGETAP